MAQRNVGTVPVHCYTNPSFCIQSEFIPEGHHRTDEFLPATSSPSPSPPPPPPPPSQQYQAEEILPPPPLSYSSSSSQRQQSQVSYGQSNPAFQSQPENASVLYHSQQQHDIGTAQIIDRYCYLPDENRAPPPTHRRYASLPVQDQQINYNNQSLRYEYIPEDTKTNQLQRRASLRYESQKRSVGQNTNSRIQLQTCRSSGPRYAVVPGEQDYIDNETSLWTNDNQVSPIRRQIRTPRGCYTSLQQEEPPVLPERNLPELSAATRSSLATQKLHEILTTPRKPRSRSAERTVSPRRHYSAPQTGTPQRKAFTPNGSPTGRTPNPTQRETPHGTPQGRAFSPGGFKSSTPNKEPSARRCLPLSEYSSRHQDICSMTNYDHADVHSRYARLENGTETMSLVTTSPKYQMTSANQQRSDYLNIESAFMAKTAVVPPLSPPNSEANTTLMSGTEKMERKNAPFLLILVGILTCGLALYLSWSQGRKYYFDSAIGCGACCTLAGACRSLRRTWTGLGLAGLSALSCAGLLLLAAKTPRAGTPLHDVTAGALCGVSLLGASLALLALLGPKCRFSRHRRVHNWIPQFSP